MDPFLIFWLPFYSEVKMVLLLYLVAPATRGSGVIYRRWLHPFLCDKEEEIDAVLQRVKEQGTNTAMTWIHQGVQWLGGVIVRGAVKGGGGLMQQLKRSYSLTDLGEQQFDQHRFTDVTEEEEGGYFSPGMRRRQHRGGQHPNHPLMARSPDRYLSNESLSSGYNTDFFPGPGGEPMETGDYELWAPNRVPSPSSPTPPPPPLQMGSPPHLVPGGMAFPPGGLPPSGGVGIPNPQLSSSAPNTIFSPVYAPRQKAKGRTRPAQEQASDDDEETFFDSETLPTPFGVVRPGQLTSPSSSCCPSDRESLAGDYSDREEEGWGGGRTPTFHPPHSPYYCPPSDGDVTPTRCPSPLPQPPMRKPREATGMRAHKGAGDEDRTEREQQVQAEKLLREEQLKETDEEQRGDTKKDQDKAIISKEDSQKNEETQCNEELAKKEEMSMKEELQKKEKKVEQEEKERSIREERERDKRILKEIEEREIERQVREKKRIAEEKEKERLKVEKEKERLKEEKEKERLKEEKEKERLEEENEKERSKEEKENERLKEEMVKERLKEEREEREREEERKAIVARAKKEAKEQRKSWAEEKSNMSAKGSSVLADLEDELKVKEDTFLQKELEDAIQNEDTGFVDMKTADSRTPTQACQIPTAFQSGKEPGQTSNKVESFERGKGAGDANEASDEHIYEDIDDLRTKTSQMRLRQLEDASKDETGSDDSLSKPKSGKKSRAPLPPGVSSSLSSSLSSSPGVSSFAGSNSNLVQPEERIRHLTPVRMSKEEEEDGQVFYRSPGYPAPPRSRSITQINTSAPPTLPDDQPIKESVTSPQ